MIVMKHLYVHFGDSLSFEFREVSHNLPEKCIIVIDIYITIQVIEYRLTLAIHFISFHQILSKFS